MVKLCIAVRLARSSPAKVPVIGGPCKGMHRSAGLSVPAQSVSGGVWPSLLQMPSMSGTAGF